MLPRKCLTSCQVPYLCMIACPLNNQLEQLHVPLEIDSGVKIDPSEPLGIEIAKDAKPVVDIQIDNAPTVP